MTGASTGIGRAIGERLAADGAQALLVARDAVALELACERIRASGGRASFCAVDITATGASERIVEAAVQTMGGVDILVNCASATINADFFALTDEQWAQGFEVKVFAAIRLSRAAWPLLKASRGSLVNICGIGARTPMAENAMTGALSGALNAITKALADRGVADGVQVNAINPGIIQTPRIEGRIDTGASHGEERARVLDAALAERALGRGATRIGQPEDVSNLVAYIVSPAGDFLQGAIIDLDGGATKAV